MRKLVAYTDGSFKENGNLFGSGIVYLEDDKVIHTVSNKVNVGEYAVHHNIAAEVDAAIDAVLYAIENKYTHLQICHDYIGIGHWSTGVWRAKKKMTIGYVQFMAKARGHLDISFKHVKGHSGNRYNEMADKLAEQGCYK